MTPSPHQSHLSVTSSRNPMYPQQTHFVRQLYPLMAGYPAIPSLCLYYPPAARVPIIHPVLRSPPRSWWATLSHLCSHPALRSPPRSWWVTLSHLPGVRTALTWIQCVRRLKTSVKHPRRRKDPRAQNRPKSRLKRKFHLTYQNTLQPVALTSMSVAALLSAKLPTTGTWFPVHCAWRGITSSVPAKILTTRVSGAATRVAYCPPPSKTLWHKLRAWFRVSNQLNAERLPSSPMYSSWKPRMVIYGLN